MHNRDDIRQEGILRRLRSGTPITRDRTYTVSELYRGKEYGVACHSARIDARRRSKRAAHCVEAAKMAPTFERYCPDSRTRLRGMNSDNPAERCLFRELVTMVTEEVLRLPPRERDIVQQCGLGASTIRAYADERGISERAAASLWDRVIKRLHNVSRLRRAA